MCARSVQCAVCIFFHIISSTSVRFSHPIYPGEMQLFFFFFNLWKKIKFIRHVACIIRFKFRFHYFIFLSFKPYNQLTDGIESVCDKMNVHILRNCMVHNLGSMFVMIENDPTLIATQTIPNHSWSTIELLFNIPFNINICKVTSSRAETVCIHWSIQWLNTYLLNISFVFDRIWFLFIWILQ